MNLLHERLLRNLEKKIKIKDEKTDINAIISEKIFLLKKHQQKIDVFLKNKK